MDIQKFLTQQFLENSVENILWCVGFLLAWIVLRKVFSLLVSQIVYRMIKRSSNELTIRDFMDLLRKPFEWFMTFIVLYTALSFLRFPTNWHLAPVSRFGLRFLLLKFYQVSMIVILTWMVMRFTDFFTLVNIRKAEQERSSMKIQLAPFAREVIKVLVFIIGIFVILGAAFSLDVAGILTGLGIGGLAVALAAKESLENLFASFTIFLDRPFVVGDTVQVGEITGTVERVGFRSTRIRTLDKSFLTLPNKMLIDQPLDNLTQRQFRRARYFIGLPYTTPTPVIQSICEEILQFLLDHPQTNSEKAEVRFAEFGESSLNIMILYYALTPEWEEFIQVKEAINYHIMKVVEKHGISFAYPTRTIRIENEADGKPLSFTINEK